MQIKIITAPRFPLRFPIVWDAAAYAVLSSIRIESVVTNRINTFNFTTIDAEFLEETEVIVTSMDEAIRYFAGYIKEIKRDVEGVNRVYHYKCQDYTILLNRVLVNETYEDKTDGYILNDLFTTYLPEINATTYTMTGITHAKITFNRLTLRQVLDMLSGESGLDWYVDYSKYLHYFTKETNLAPFGLSDNPDEAATYPFSGMKYKRDTMGIKNRIMVIGGYYLSDNAEFELPANNQTTEFLLPYQMHKASDKTIIEVWINDGNDAVPDWTAQGVGIDYIEALGGPIDVLYSYQEKLLKFGAAPPDLARAIKVRGRYEVPVLMRTRSQESYKKYGRWFDGLVVNKDINSRGWAKDEGKAELAKNAFQREKGVCQITQDGLFAGQRINIVDTLRDINDGYLIHKVMMRYLGGTTCLYTIHYGEYNPDLVDMIIANKARQHQDVREGEVLNELFEQAETLGLTEATDRHEDAYPPDTSRWIAKPPAQSVGHHVRHEALALSEATARSEAATEDYKWDAAGTKWDFFTWA